MKFNHTLSILAFALFCLSGCKDSNDPKPMVASSNIIKKDFPLENFTGLLFGMGADIILATGEDENYSITIEAPDNLIDSFQVKKIQDNAYISFHMNQSFMPDFRPKYYISMPSVAYISISSGSLSNKENSSIVGHKNHQGVTELVIDISGDSKVNLDINADYLKTMIEEPQTLEFLPAEINYTGSVVKHEIQNFGDLTFEGFGLTTTETKISTSKSSFMNCKIFTSDELIIEGAGYGTVTYKDSPDVYAGSSWNIDIKAANDSEGN